MKPDIIVVGTGHELQTGHSQYSIDQHRAFQKFLENLCNQYNIKLIAEEMSEDILPDCEVSETNSKQVAVRRGIQHQYVDLTAVERLAFGIDRLSLHKISQSAKLSTPQVASLERLAGEFRECVWLTRILALNKWPTLFICGADHAPRVEYLFNSVGKLAHLESNDYKP